MRNLFFSTLVLISTALLLTGFRAVVDVDPTAVLQSSKSKLQSLADFEAQFSYILGGPGMPKPLVKDGFLKYKQGKWSVKMDQDEFFCDLESVWLYNNDDNSVTVLEYDPEESMNVDALFELYEAQSDPRYEGEETIGGKKCHKVFLAIKDRDLDYNQAWIWIGKTDKLPVKAVLKTRNQSETTISLSGVKSNRGFGDESFQFDESKYPGVTVYDER